RVEQVLARVYVDDLDVALPLYERLADGAPVRRFGFRAIELAWVGPFLLLAGAPDDLAPFRDRAATSSSMTPTPWLPRSPRPAGNCSKARVPHRTGRDGSRGTRTRRCSS